MSLQPGFWHSGAGAALGGNLRLSGTSIGDMTESGGLASVFDGTTSQARNNSAGSANIDPGLLAYVGKNFSAAPKRIYKSVSYGSNDDGYIRGQNASMTIWLRGKNGSAPSSATDGTLLGSLTFTDTSNESGNPREIESSDKETQWDYVWLTVEQAGASKTSLHVAELELYEAV